MSSQKKSRNSQQNTYNPNLHAKCVCQLCSCNKHHCPQHQKDQPHHLQTNFQESFKRYKPQSTKPYNYDRPILNHNYDKDLIKSNYQNDYIKYKIPAKEIREGSKSVEANQPFFANSEYRQNFKKYPLNTFKPKQHKAELEIPEPKFEAQSLYNSDYKAFRVQNEGPIRVELKPGYEHQTNLGKSMYQEQYQQFPVKMYRKPEQFKQMNIQGDPGVFQKNSTYKGDYIQLNQNHALDVCLVKQLPPYPQQLSPGRSHLQYDSIRNGWR